MGYNFVDILNSESDTIDIEIDTNTGTPTGKFIMSEYLYHKLVQPRSCRIMVDDSGSDTVVGLRFASSYLFDRVIDPNTMSFTATELIPYATGFTKLERIIPTEHYEATIFKAVV